MAEENKEYGRRSSDLTVSQMVKCFDLVKRLGYVGTFTETMPIIREARELVRQIEGE